MQWHNQLKKKKEIRVKKAGTNKKVFGEGNTSVNEGEIGDKDLETLGTSKFIIEPLFAENGTRG